MIRDHKGPYGTIQGHTGPYGATWGHTGPHWTIRDHKGPCGAIQSHTGPYGVKKIMEYMLNPIAHRLGTVCYGGRGAESSPQLEPYLGVANRVK